MSPGILATTHALLAPIRGAERVDAAKAYVQPLSSAVLSAFMGVDAKDGSWLRAQAAAVTDPVSNPAFIEANSALGVYLERRLLQPSGGAIGYLQRCRPDGRRLDPAFVIDALRFLVIAGADTTAGVLGAALHHLSLHPAEAEQLRRDPSRLGVAVEEFVRLYAPVTPARFVTEDVCVNGAALNAGDMVLLSYAAANRDPQQFPTPDEVDLTREKNPHLGFGAGIHRCMGIHLARQTLQIALEAWLDAVPRFTPEDGAVEWSGGIVRGPLSLPFRLNGPEPFRR